VVRYSLDMSASYLVVLGEGEAIAWVLREQRMAFPEKPRREVGALKVGDELFIYTTRGAWHNPTRDQGRIVGRAVVVSSVTKFQVPFSIAGRSFPSGCGLDVQQLAPYPQGVELRKLVTRLDAFPEFRTWSARLRRPLVALSDHDAELIRIELAPLGRPRDEALRTYLERLRAGDSTQQSGTGPA
jgi:hypothetical protein